MSKDRKLITKIRDYAFDEDMWDSEKKKSRTQTIEERRIRRGGLKPKRLKNLKCDLSLCKLTFVR